ncbi:hypothetical protein DHEL01_v204946 [Diaporthe helianthi]|uniref:Uncharacterized protein n=1 Tax=Diaporthe helianthi TaxID=158607 RepID=A0A2P5I2A7_DIAHE|nr:hypothetical protein DHEL01_v204946 [Diaporthe helianthi]
MHPSDMVDYPSLWCSEKRLPRHPLVWPPKRLHRATNGRRVVYTTPRLTRRASLNTTAQIATASSSWWVGPRGTRPWTWPAYYTTDPGSGHVALQGRRRYYRVGHPALSNALHHQDNPTQPDTQSLSLHRPHRRLDVSPHAICLGQIHHPRQFTPSSVYIFGAIGQGTIHRKALDAVGLGRLPATEGDRPRRPGSIPGSGDRGVKISNQNNNGGGVGYAERLMGVPLEPFDSAFWKALTHPFPPRRGLILRTLRVIDPHTPCVLRLDRYYELTTRSETLRHSNVRVAFPSFNAPWTPLIPGAWSWQRRRRRRRRRTGDVVLAVTTRTRPRLMLQLQAEICREDASCRIPLGQIATNHDWPTLCICDEAGNPSIAIGWFGIRSSDCYAVLFATTSPSV